MVPDDNSLTCPRVSSAASDDGGLTETDGSPEIGVLRATNTLLLDQLAAVQATAEKYVALAQSAQKQGEITQTRLAEQTDEVARLTALTEDLTLRAEAQRHADMAALADFSARIATLEQQKLEAEAETGRRTRDLDDLGAAHGDLRLQQTDLTQEITALQNSTSWRLTAPLRAISRTIRHDRR